MSEIKVSLTIVLPGRTMMSQEQAEALEKVNQQGFTKHSLVVETTSKNKKKKVERETIYFKTRNNISATQSININKDAYEYMTGKECPSFISSNEWKRMGKIKKLEAHLYEIALSRGGKVLNYCVFEN